MAKYDSDTKAFAEAVGTAIAVLHSKMLGTASVPSKEATKHSIGSLLGTRAGYREKLRDFAFAAYLAAFDPQIEVH